MEEIDFKELLGKIDRTLERDPSYTQEEREEIVEALYQHWDADNLLF